AGRYLKRAPTRADVKSIWLGLRPSVRPPDNEGNNTKKISRVHTELISTTGLVTLTGGKWITDRAMAEDTLQECMVNALLERLPPSSTANLKLVGAASGRKSMTHTPGLLSYGTEAAVVQGLPGADIELAPGFSVAMVRFAAR